MSAKAWSQRSRSVFAKQVLLVLRQGLILRTQQIIDGVIASGKIDADGGCSRGEQCCNRVGLAAVLPIRVSTGSYRELKRSALAGVEGVHGRAGGDERADNVVMSTPGSKEELNNEFRNSCNWRHWGDR
jgi:hypothetical protein